ncbi:MAG TPA: biotin/lipoyl-binding protein, partial [Pirellulaceae bacterium]
MSDIPVTQTASVKSRGPAAPALAERVQSLRLPSNFKKRDRGGWLPWLLFVLMSGFAGWLGFQLYVRSSSDTRMRATPVSSPGELSAVNADPRGDVPRDRENKNVAIRTGSDGQSPAAESPSPSDTEDPARIVLESKGYVVARRQVLVSPQVSGRLVHLDLEEGMVVEKGQILARV